MDRVSVYNNLMWWYYSISQFTHRSSRDDNLEKTSGGKVLMLLRLRFLILPVRKGRTRGCLFSSMIIVEQRHRKTKDNLYVVATQLFIFVLGASMLASMSPLEFTEVAPRSLNAFLNTRRENSWHRGGNIIYPFERGDL